MLGATTLRSVRIKLGHFECVYFVLRFGVVQWSQRVMGCGYHYYSMADKKSTGRLICVFFWVVVNMNCNVCKPNKLTTSLNHTTFPHP